MFDTTVMKDIITSACSVIAVIIACRGLTTWKRQLLHTENRKVVKQVMFDTLQLEQELSSIRSPMIFLSEPELKDDEKAKLNDKAKRWRANVQYYERAMKEVFQKSTALRSSTLEARVLFGIEALEVVKPLLDNVTTYWAEKTLNLDVTNPDSDESYEPGERKKTHQILYRGSEGPFDKAITENVDRIIEFYSQLLHEKEKKWHQFL